MTVSARADDVGRALSDVLETTNHRFASIFVPPKFFPTPENLRSVHPAVLDQSLRREDESAAASAVLGTFQRA